MKELITFIKEEPYSAACICYGVISMVLAVCVFFGWHEPSLQSVSITALTGVSIACVASALSYYSIKNGR